MKSLKKPLDPVVKIGLTVMVGAFVLIGGGMFLSRPDRSIPPYSVGSQEDALVAIHVPPWTSDPEIQTLIRRFQKFRSETGDFGPMKIRPTTPEDPQGRYRQITILIFSDHQWTDPEILHRFLHPSKEPRMDQRFREEFVRAVRGGYQFDGRNERGWLGRWWMDGLSPDSPEIQWLFQDSKPRDSYTPGAVGQEGKSSFS